MAEGIVIAAVSGGAALCARGCGLLLSLLAQDHKLVRRNYRGDVVVTAGGICLVPAVIAIAALGPTLRGWQGLPALLLAFALLGYVDDRWGTPEHRGIRGHLQACVRGRLTTGLVKAVGGLAVSIWFTQPLLEVGVWAWAIGSLTLALSANAFNLADLRPLRALKLFWCVSPVLVLLFGPTALFLIAATAGYAPLERRRRVMLGDTGANLLGAAAGLAALSLPPAAVAGVAAVLIAFHAWAERHSLSEWIDRHPLARRLDRLGGWDEPVPAE